MQYNFLFPVLEFNKTDSHDRYYPASTIRQMFEACKAKNEFQFPVVFIDNINRDPKQYFSVRAMNFAGFASLTQGSGNTIFADIKTSLMPDGLFLRKMLEENTQLEFHLSGIIELNKIDDQIQVIKLEPVYITVHPK